MIAVCISASVVGVIIVVILAVVTVNKNFLRFHSVNDFSKMDCYINEKEPSIAQSEIMEWHSAMYIYNGKLIHFQAVIYKTYRSAAKQFNKYNISDSFAFYAAKCFSRGFGKIQRARLFKNTFLLVEGEPGEEFNAFYDLVLSCLSAKSKPH